MKKFLSFFLKLYGYILRVEYLFTSYTAFIFLKLKGTNFKKRLKNTQGIKLLKNKLTKKAIKRVAIFVAFHSFDKIPQSNINYLRILEKSSFEIIYVHNGLLEKKVKKFLKNKGYYVICRENIGQDFGAWKDTISLLEEFQLTKNLDWLLLCNDSNFCLGGRNAEKFQNHFKRTLEIKNNKFDFISLNLNTEGRAHHQSYFLCLSKVVVSDKKFKDFWRNYIPLNNRYHAIKNGEVKFSELILKRYKPKVLLTSSQLSLSMRKNKIPNFNFISNLLPQNLFFLEACFYPYDSKESDNKILGIIKLINCLKGYNPSHVFGLLNIFFLESPFLKKDIVRMGVFEIKQIHALLSLNKLNIEKASKNEIIKFLENEGNPNNYLKLRRLAVRKGIPVFKNLYEYLPVSKALKKTYYMKDNS